MKSSQPTMAQTDAGLQAKSVFAALHARATAESSSWLARVTGTHGLLLDAIEGAEPQAQGLGRWTALCLSPHEGRFEGPLRAEPGALPFCDNSFGAVLIRHLAGAGLPIDELANEAARVLAQHGVLLVIECHPLSGWGSWLSARAQPPLRAIAPHHWRKALRSAGLVTGDPLRCGAPWPSTRALPHWLERLCGGAWLLAARKCEDAMVVQRRQPLRARGIGNEQTSWLPGAHRLRG